MVVAVFSDSTRPERGHVEVWQVPSRLVQSPFHLMSRAGNGSCLGKKNTQRQRLSPPSSGRLTSLSGYSQGSCRETRRGRVKWAVLLTAERRCGSVCNSQSRWRRRHAQRRSSAPGGFTRRQILILRARLRVRFVPAEHVAHRTVRYPAPIIFRNRRSKLNGNRRCRCVNIGCHLSMGGGGGGHLAQTGGRYRIIEGIVRRGIGSVRPAHTCPISHVRPRVEPPPPPPRGRHRVTTDIRAEAAVCRADGRRRAVSPCDDTHTWLYVTRPTSQLRRLSSTCGHRQTAANFRSILYLGLALQSTSQYTDTQKVTW